MTYNQWIFFFQRYIVLRIVMSFAKYRWINYWPHDAVISVRILSKIRTLKAAIKRNKALIK